MIFSMLQGLLCETLGCDESEIKKSTGLFDDLELSDSDLQDVMDAMAEELGFTWEAEAVHDVLTVADLVRYIEGRI